MKKKLNVSLSLKLTLVIVTVSAISISIVAAYNIFSQEAFFEDAHYPKAATLIQALNATIGDNDSLRDFDIVENKISHFINTTDENIKPDIVSVAIIRPDENEDLKVFYSTDNEKIGNFSRYRHFHEVCYNSNGKDDSYFIMEHGENYHILTMISPINFTGFVGDTVVLDGTYELIISMDQAYDAHNTRVSYIIFVSVLFLFLMVFGFLYLLGRITVKPIIKFRDKAKIIGKGDLDTQIDIKSRDELGELANAFNQMARDLKESRNKIQDYTKILERLLDQKDEFIGQLGHDLKNPLQPLVGLLPMLIEQEKDPSIKESLEVMNQNVEYMQDLIFKTLQLAKLRSADVKFDIENVKLRDEAENAIASQVLHLKENKIDIEDHIDENIIVEADKLRLSEVFKNLIANAVKYTKNSGKITLDAEQEDDIVTVSVIDTGIGMTEDQIKKIFDEFYKADRATTELQSSGLGLAICKRIIEKLGGKIWVDSQGPGKGSTFYFTLKTGTKNN